MLVLLVLACGATPPGTPSTTETGAPSGPTASTAETGVPSPTGATGGHTGWTPPGPSLAVTVDAFGACPDPYETTQQAVFTATSSGGGEVQLSYDGVVGGCGCVGTVYAWTEGSSDIVLRIDAGDCDALFCCEVDATLQGVASGTWDLRVDGYSGAATSVSVP